MVSSGLSQLLERARVRFGLEVEILDASLKRVYPESGTDLTRMIEDSADVRRALLETLAAGRPQQLHDTLSDYRFYALRRTPRQHAAGLLAIRQQRMEAYGDVEPWSDLARAIVEADLAASESLGEERQRSRKFVGTLRFLELVTRMTDEATLAMAMVQAASVWYDLDARIYRRTLDNDYQLHTLLPGVAADEGPTMVPAAVFGMDRDVHRLPSAGDLRRSATGYEATVVPLATAADAEWVMALIGSVPADGEAVLRLLGRVAGSQLEVIQSRHASAARDAFKAVLSRTTDAPELTALRALGELARQTTAESGVLTLLQGGRGRRMAAVGSASSVASVTPAPHVDEARRLVRSISLGGDDRAVLELAAASRSEFTADAAAVTDACVVLLQPWLVGVLAARRRTAIIFDQPTDTAAFSTRIREELDRAKRFNLRLSLVLIDVDASSDAVALLTDVVRQELRGSDVTGAMSERRVAVLLTHTDAEGTEYAVQRLRRRLATEAAQWDVADLRLGKAALSPDCSTADALLALALHQAEPVIVH